MIESVRERCSYSLIVQQLNQCKLRLSRRSHCGRILAVHLLVLPSRGPYRRRATSRLLAARRRRAACSHRSLRPQLSLNVMSRATACVAAEVMVAAAVAVVKAAANPRPVAAAAQTHEEEMVDRKSRRTTCTATSSGRDWRQFPGAPHLAQ